jgi:hypothetical protein
MVFTVSSIKLLVIGSDIENRGRKHISKRSYRASHPVLLVMRRLAALFVESSSVLAWRAQLRMCLF